MNHSNHGGVPEVSIIGLGQQGTVFAKKLRDDGVSIYGIDTDDNKREKFKKEFPNASVYFPGQTYPGTSGEADMLPDNLYYVRLPQGIPTIVASNTPDHKRAIEDRIGADVKNILAEKPLALTLKQTLEIQKLAGENGVDIYTALLIRFSPAVKALEAFMQDNNLVMTSGTVDWGKNRIGNKRPTAGDLEDEAVHGIDILFLFASLNQQIESMSISGRLSFDKYVDEVIQKSMHEQDSSYPLIPNSSSSVLTSIETTHGKIDTLLNSSFVAPTERRIVTVRLAKKSDPRTPLYEARMDFDKRLPEGGVKDLLQIHNLQDTKSSIPLQEYQTDKMGDQTKAWLDAIKGVGAPDSRHATIDQAVNLAKWTDAVIRSDKRGKVIKLSN